MCHPVELTVEQLKCNINKRCLQSIDLTLGEYSQMVLDCYLHLTQYMLLQKKEEKKMKIQPTVFEIPFSPDFSPKKKSFIKSTILNLEEN